MQPVFDWVKNRLPVNPEKKRAAWRYPCGTLGCPNLIRGRGGRTGFCPKCSKSSAMSTSAAVRNEAARLGRNLTVAEAKATRRNERIANGICGDCCKEPLKPGCARCIYCTGLSAIRQRRRRDAQKALLKGSLS